MNQHYPSKSLHETPLFCNQSIISKHTQKLSKIRFAIIEYKRRKIEYRKKEFF